MEARPYEKEDVVMRLWRWWGVALVAFLVVGLPGARAQEGAGGKAGVPTGASADCRELESLSAKDRAACQAKAGAANGKAGPADGKAAGDSKVAGDGKAAPDVFAFPEEQSKHGADAEEMPTTGVPDPPTRADRSGSGSSSSSSSSSGLSGVGVGGSSSRDGQPDEDADVAPTTVDPHAPVKAGKLKDLGSKGDTTAARQKLEATREEDDVRVGGFYLKEGNAAGAYARFKEAVGRDAGDPDAQFGLAEAARKLNKGDEAAVHYRECLKIDAGGDHAKAARKALAQMETQAKR